MSKTWSLRFGLVLLAVAFGPTAVDSAETQQPIRIGYLSSLSGPFAPWGILVREGMKLAIAEVNGAGGVAGRQLELVERDDRNNPSEAVTAFQYMIEREHVVAVGGIISSDVGLAASREAEVQKVPLFLTMSGSDAVLTKESRYTFRTCLPAAPMNMGYIAGLIQEKHYTRVGAIVADYAWGHAINDAIDASVKPLPGVKLQVEVAPVSERDFTPYLRKLQDLNPELLIATGHPPGSVTVARQAIELGLGGQIIGPWYPTEFTPERGGDLIFGRFVDYTCADFDSPDYQRLAAKFHSASNHLLGINGISGYAIVKILVQAITEKKSTDPKVLADAVRTGRFVISGYGWPLSYTEWGEMKEAAPLLYTYERGSPPDDVNPAANWRTKVVFRSKPVQPYLPGK